MVSARRDDLYNTKTQMKLSIAISTAAIVGMSFLAQSAGYAQTQIKQLKVGQSSDMAMHIVDTILL